MVLKKIKDIIPLGELTAHASDLKILSNYTMCKKGWEWTDERKYQRVYSDKDVECVIAHYNCYMGGFFIIKGISKYFAFRWNRFYSGYSLERVSLKDALKSIREGIEISGYEDFMVDEDEVKKIELKEMIEELKK